MLPTTARGKLPLGRKPPLRKPRKLLLGRKYLLWKLRKLPPGRKKLLRGKSLAAPVGSRGQARS